MSHVRFLRPHGPNAEGSVRPVSKAPVGDELDFQIADVWVLRGICEWERAAQPTTIPASIGSPAVVMPRKNLKR